MTLAAPDRLLRAPAVDYADLVIAAENERLHLGAVATSVPLELTMDGTATVTVTLDEQEPGQLRDILGGFFKPDQAGRPRLAGWNTLPLFGSTYVLREISRNPQGAWDLVCYDQASEQMKRFTGPIKVSRGERTRAEVVGMLARQAGVPAWLPGRHDRSVIHALAPDDLKTLRAGRPTSSGDTPILAAVDAARRAGFRGETLVNMVAISGRETGGTYDPTVQNLVPPDHSIGLWQINQLAHHGRYGTDAQLKDPATNARAAKKLYDAAGYSPWKGPSGSWRDNITTAMFNRARKAVEKGVDTGGPNGNGTVDRAYVERFEFKVGKRETYWDASGRLAQDVKWPRFAVFNSLVYASDLTLAADPTPYEFDEADDWVDTVTWTCTSRERIDEMQITGRLAALIPPGSAITVKDDSLPTWGTWLVRNFKRVDLLDPECQVELTLGRPRAPLPEPSSKVRTVSGGSVNADERVAKAYRKAVEISKKKYPYVFGGGHGSFSGPYDCSGFVSAVLHAADLLDTPMATGGLIGWGKAGRGKQMTVWVHETSDPHASHTFITFNVGNGQEIFEAGGGGGPTGRRTSRSFTGFEPRHWQGT